MENLGIHYDHLVYFKAFGNILGRLVYFVVIWYIFPHFGILHQEKSGNPAAEGRGPFLTLPLGANFAPRGEVVPQGEFCPFGVKLSVCPSILLNSRETSTLG
jgi:hypothetical protein